MTLEVNFVNNVWCISNGASTKSIVGESVSKRHSNSFTRVWSQSARNVPLEEWLSNGDYTRAWLDALAKKFNSAEVIDPQQDGFFVEHTFVKRLCRGGKDGGTKCNPGMYAWDKTAKKKRCIIRIQNKGRPLLRQSQ